jgi:cytochrome c-type biogenesis protein CcmF
MAAALSALQMLAGIAALRGMDRAFAAMVRPAAIVQAVLAALSFAAIVWLFAITDLSVQLVADNSHVDKPMLFKLAGAWGNHEGSMLLWVSVLALSGAMIAALEHRLPERTMQATLAAQAAVAAGFYAFLLFSSNPFKRLIEPAAEGQGLNPLLQDIGLALHPPTLYIGYVGLSVAFSFAVGALLTGQVTRDFARVMRPWVLIAWIFLTLGITAGSYWAYYELGWGGWWFWDPVENASLMPWLAATALLHSVSVLAARDALRTWTIILGVVAFSMSMVGTFLVRSGILTSVHAFAVDPERGAFILALLAIYIGGALLLFALRAHSIAEGRRFAPASRETALVINNIGLSAILGVVLLGTLYPLLTEAFGVRVSVGPPYFNPVSAIFFLPLVAALFVGPVLRWRRDEVRRLGPGPVIAAGVAVLATIAGIAAGAGVLAALGLGGAAGLAIASFLPLAGRNLLRTPLPVWGMVIAHFGLAVSLAGAASDAAFSQEKLVAARPGDVAEIGPYRVALAGVDPVAGPNWTALEARLLAERGGTQYALGPQQRTYWSPSQQTSESVQLTGWDGQLYAVLGADAGEGRWQLRLWWKPFVTLIWLGGILIALGGALSLIGRMVSETRRRAIRARLTEDAA